MRCLLAVTALVLSLTSAQGAELTRILVGFPPGQATDLVARLIGERLGPSLGENIIVENRPGQGGSSALASLLQSAADGHTMVLAPLASLVVNPHMYKAVSYNTLKDFAPVALVADLPLHHGDPFDRLLIAQAIEEPMHLLTTDSQLRQYSELVIQV